MTDHSEATLRPGEAAAVAAPAPDPRRDYASPEDLREDIALGLDEREHLLRQWKHDVQSELEAEAEGMSASDPIAAEAEASLAAEVRRVNKALASVERDNRLARGESC